MRRILTTSVGRPGNCHSPCMLCQVYLLTSVSLFFFISLLMVYTVLVFLWVIKLLQITSSKSSTVLFYIGPTIYSRPIFNNIVALLFSAKIYPFVCAWSLMQAITPCIHRNILISVLSIRLSCILFPPLFTIIIFMLCLSLI